MEDLEIYFYKQVFTISKSEIFLSSYTEMKIGSKIEIMFHTRGSIHIIGSDLRKLYKKIKNKSDFTSVEVGNDNVKGVEMYIPDCDLEVYKSATEQI